MCLYVLEKRLEVVFAWRWHYRGYPVFFVRSKVIIFYFIQL